MFEDQGRLKKMSKFRKNRTTIEMGKKKFGGFLELASIDTWTRNSRFHSFFVLACFPPNLI